MTKFETTTKRLESVVDRLDAIATSAVSHSHEVEKMPCEKCIVLEAKISQTLAKIQALKQQLKKMMG